MLLSSTFFSFTTLSLLVAGAGSARASAPLTWSTAGGSPQRTLAAPAGTALLATDGTVAWRWASGNYTRHVASAVTPAGTLLVVSRTLPPSPSGEAADAAAPLCALTELGAADARVLRRAATAWCAVDPPPLPGAPVPGGALTLSGDGALLLAATDAGAVVALEAASWLPRWQFAGDGGAAAAPAVSADGAAVFVATATGAYVLDAADGALLWNATGLAAPGGAALPPTLLAGAGGLAVFATAAGVLAVAVDAADPAESRVAWSWAPPADGQPHVVLAAPLADAARGLVYVYYGTNAAPDVVVALDAASGAAAWAAPGAVGAQPVPPRTCAVSAARRLVCSGPALSYSPRPDSFAVDLASGSPMWASAACGGPVVAAGPDGAVYCAADAALVALDAARGAVAWALDTSPLCAAGVPARVLGAAAVLPSGALVLSVQCSTNASAATPGRLDEGFLLALAPVAPPSPSPSPSPGAAGPLAGVWAAGDHGDAQRDGRAARAPPLPLSGGVAWSVNMGDSGYAARGGLAFDGGDTLFAVRANEFGVNAGIFAINTTSGAVRWRFKSTSCPGFAPPVATRGGTALTAGCGQLLALSARDGSVQWSVAVADMRAPPLVAGGGAILVPRARWLEARSAWTGEWLWAAALPAPTPPSPAPSAVSALLSDDGATVVLGMDDGGLVALSISGAAAGGAPTGAALAWQVPGAALPQPAPDGQVWDSGSGAVLYTASSSHELLVLGGADGAVRARVAFCAPGAGGAAAAPAVSARTAAGGAPVAFVVWVANASGAAVTVAAIDLDARALLWSAPLGACDTLGNPVLAADGTLYVPRNLTSFALVDTRARGALRELAMGVLPSNQWISGFTAAAALAPDGRVALRHFAVPADGGDGGDGGAAAARTRAPADAADDCLAHWTGCDTISLMSVTATAPPEGR